MGKNRSRPRWPEERSSAKWLVPLKGEEADPKGVDPEARLIAAEEGPQGDADEGGALGTWEDMEVLVARLDPSDRDIMTLYYRDGMRQCQIGLVMGMTQGGVSYRIRKARRRLEYLRTVPVLTRDGVDRDLSFLSPPRRELFWQVYLTTSQTVTAKVLNELGVPHPALDRWTQSTVRTSARALLRDLRARREGSALKEALRGTEWGLRASFRLGAGRSSPPDAEALRRAKEELESHLDSLASLDPYVEFLDALFRDKRWGVLHLTRFPWNAEVRARKMAEAGVTLAEEDDRGPDDP